MSAPPPPPPPPPPGPSPSSGGAPHQYPGGRSRQFQRQNVVVSPSENSGMSPAPPPGGPPPPSALSPSNLNHHANENTNRHVHVISPTSASLSPSANKPPQQQQETTSSHGPDHVTIGGTDFGQIVHQHGNNDSDDDYHHDSTSKSSGGNNKRRLIRRGDSFRKLSTLSQDMEQWFFTDVEFHNAIKEFVNSMPRDLVGAAQVDVVSADTMSMNLQAQEYHERFCELFEEHLENALDERNVPIDSFTERLRLDKEEEERDGTHFRRWLEVIEFPQFVALISPSPKLLEDHNGNIGAAGLHNLLDSIHRLSEDARRKFRKSSILAPIMWAWAPSSFGSFDEVLQTTLKKLDFVHAANGSLNTNALKLSKTDAKSMLRWKAKLKTPVLNEHGVYAPPPVHHDEFVSYISAVTVGLEDEDFDRFTSVLRGEIKVATTADEHRLEELKKIKTASSPITNNSLKKDFPTTAAGAGAKASSQKQHVSEVEEAEDLMVSIEQRLLLEFFFELDVRHQGKIPLFSALKFMLQAGAISSEKELRRTMLKFRHTAKKQPGEVQLELQHQYEEELKRRRSSMMTNATGSEGGPSRSNSNVNSLAGRRASNVDSEHQLARKGSSIHQNQMNHEDDEEEDSDDPHATFHYFLAVVKEPLRAVIKKRTIKKLLGHDFDDDAGSNTVDMSALYDYHEEFLNRIKHLREVWKDKQ